MNLWDLESNTKVWTAKSVSCFFYSGHMCSHIKESHCYWRKHLIAALNVLQPAKNSLGIFTPTWFTSTTFLNKDDHRKFVSGTNDHQVNFKVIT